MGFGTFFVGYFFLLNLTWVAYTDAVAGALMLAGAMKLAAFARPFRRARIPAGMFTALGLFELAAELFRLFGVTLLSDPLGQYLAIARYLLLAWLNVEAILGVRLIAKEVGLRKLVTRAEASVASPVIVFLFSAVLEIPGLFDGVEVTLTATVGNVCLLLTIFVIAFNLVTFYQAMTKIALSSESAPELPKGKG